MVEYPFEFRALEAALEAICSFLDARTTELETATYPALDELTSKASKRIHSVKPSRNTLETSHMMYTSSQNVLQKRVQSESPEEVRPSIPSVLIDSAHESGVLYQDIDKYEVELRNVMINLREKLREKLTDKVEQMIREADMDG